MLASATGPKSTKAKEKPGREDYRGSFGGCVLDSPLAQGRVAEPGRPTQVWRGDREVSPYHDSFASIGLPPAADLARAAHSYRHFRLHQSDDIDSWCESFPGSSEHANLFRDMHRSAPAAADKLAEALTDLPEAGTTFLGFELMQELGRGAFGRVYLARQGDLANRLVALKVSSDILGESQVLAQLQHTNIVPIYSMHRAAPFQAVCMPYFGATTLKHVLDDLEGRDSLPDSGKGLVSTLNQRKSATLPWRSTHPLVRPKPDRPKQPAEPTPVQPQPTSGEAEETPAVTLKMLEGLSYVHAVLWVGARLADGLAHAHERGILHRDLKPENVLLTEDGQPMLLDFNLSQDTKLLTNAAAAAVGGTLPYMAPEHLLAFQGGARTVDARSDVYALGIILYELLTARYPFPTYPGLVKSALPQMVKDRQQSPPRLRCWNKAVSPAVESIVRHCLEPQPGERYQSARDLLEDLERHLHDLPLKHAPEPSLRERTRKWVRRHPRLTSTTSVAVFAAAVVIALGTVAFLRGQRLSRLQAVECLNEFHGEMQTAQFLLYKRTPDPDQVEEGFRQCRAALDRYHVIDNPRWQESADVRNLPAESRDRLREDVGELLFLCAGANGSLLPGRGAATVEEKTRGALRLNDIATSCYDEDRVPRAVWLQRGELLACLQQNEAAEQALRKAGETPLRTARDRYLAARMQQKAGNYRKALALLEEATQLDPQDFSAWFVKGYCHDALKQHAEATACYSTCLALRPAFHWAWFNRGLAHLNQLHYQKAYADFDQAARLAPTEAEIYLNRAMAREGLTEYARAIEDLNEALRLGNKRTQIYFMRASVREKAGDRDGAKRDRDLGMRQQPADELSWVARGLARMQTDANGALADFEAALKLNPLSFPALENKAHVLAEHLGNDQEAVRVLDKAIALYPDSVLPRAGRGVHLARLGKKEAALEDARQALLRDTEPPNLYQVSGIYALTSKEDPKNRLRALELLSLALKGGYGLQWVDIDKDLDPIRNSDDFRRIVQAARALQPGPAKATP
jgi:serine/threonine protein kinase/tetratricopeptide (TPR) repeat protein